MFEEVLDALQRHGCRFVVVGSVARLLAGERVVPHDLDLVIDASLTGRERFRLALRELAAIVETRQGWQQIERCPLLPWEWGFRVQTADGQVDLISTFIDGTTIEEHEASAVTVEFRPGCSVRVRPTRHVQPA